MTALAPRVFRNISGDCQRSRATVLILLVQRSCVSAEDQILIDLNVEFETLSERPGHAVDALVHNSRSRSIIALHPEIRGPA